MASTPPKWHPTSWKSFPAQQQPDYKDKGAAASALDKVGKLPPLVSCEEVDVLKTQLAEVAQGRRFLLQGGDCAERFLDCSSKPIEKKLKILLQMSLVLTWGARVPTVRVGRMAGQYAKPRSSPTEVVAGKTYASFRGDNINSFDLSHREPDPERLVMGYFHAAATLNYARAVLASGIADLHASAKWDLGFVKDDATRERYRKMVNHIQSALDFMSVCGVDDKSETIRTVQHFVSHEGLTLPYETAMTRAPSTEAASSMHYNLGAHFVWIGDRTRQLDGAHVEYFRGIANPIGIKVGPTMKPDELVALIKALWPEPEKDPGKIVLITRFGAKNVQTMLPPLIRVVQEAKLPVVWTCDPMHGNTEKTTTGIKTRAFDTILEELRASFLVHSTLGSFLGGVHFELTGENVTECVGGPEQLDEEDLKKEYTTYCDPRLNYAQSMEVAFLIAEFLQKEREASGSRVRLPSPLAAHGAPAIAGASVEAGAGAGAGAANSTRGPTSEVSAAKRARK